MSKYLAERFSRITVDFAHMDGQACIRGLPITVSDVAKLATSGKSVAEIIAQYPDLEADDIHQALAYKIDSVGEIINSWVHEGVHPLKSVIGFGKLLTGETQTIGELTDEQKHEFLRIMVANAVRAEAFWWHIYRWKFMEFHSRDLEYEPIQVKDLISKLAQEIPRFNYDATLETQIPDTLPTIKSTPSIEIAMLILITDQISIHTQPHAELFVQVASYDSISIKIIRQLLYANVEYNLEILFSEGYPLSIAKHIIHQHGSELRTHVSDTDITFEFDLPIWEDDQPE